MNTNSMNIHRDHFSSAIDYVDAYMGWNIMRDIMRDIRRQMTLPGIA